MNVFGGARHHAPAEVVCSWNGKVVTPRSPGNTSPVKFYDKIFADFFNMLIDLYKQMWQVTMENIDPLLYWKWRLLSLLLWSEQSGSALPCHWPFLDNAD